MALSRMSSDRVFAPEIVEPPTILRAMTAGREVVEDYGAVGLTLRQHPLAFLRDDQAGRGIIPTAGIAGLRNNQWAEVAGLVLVRQRPGSAKGVLFITIEDETGIANLIVWPAVFEANRRTVLTAHLLQVGGRVQREGEVTHIIVRHLIDRSDDLRQIGARVEPFVMQHGRGDQVKHGSAPDPRDGPPMGRGRDMYVRDLRLGHGIEPQTEIKARTRDFR